MHQLQKEQNWDNSNLWNFSYRKKTKRHLRWDWTKQSI